MNLFLAIFHFPIMYFDNVETKISFHRSHDFALFGCEGGIGKLFHHSAPFKISKITAIITSRRILGEFVR